MSEHRPDPVQDPFAGSDAAERRWLERTRSQLTAASPPFDQARNWQRLAARIEAEADWRRACRTGPAHDLPPAGRDEATGCGLPVWPDARKDD